MDRAMNETTAGATAITRLDDVDTPCLVLDADRMDRNVARLRERLDGLGVSLRPHLKTAKSVEVARRVMVARGAGDGLHLEGSRAIRRRGRA